MKYQFEVILRDNTYTPLCTSTMTYFIDLYHFSLKIKYICIFFFIKLTCESAARPIFILVKMRVTLNGIAIKGKIRMGQHTTGSIEVALIKIEMRLAADEIDEDVGVATGAFGEGQRGHLRPDVEGARDLWVDDRAREIGCVLDDAVGQVVAIPATTYQQL